LTENLNSRGFELEKCCLPFQDLDLLFFERDPQAFL